MPNEENIMDTCFIAMCLLLKYILAPKPNMLFQSSLHGILFFSVIPHCQFYEDVFIHIPA